MDKRPRKLEFFEDQLKVSPLGREALQILYAHADEVMYLVNKNRPTMVCWQRNHGPSFVRSLVDSGFEEDVDLVKEIHGIALETLILNMAEVLQDNGSPELKHTIGKYAAIVLQFARECRSLREIIRSINQSKPEEHV